MTQGTRPHHEAKSSCSFCVWPQRGLGCQCPGVGRGCGPGRPASRGNWGGIQMRMDEGSPSSSYRGPSQVASATVLQPPALSHHLQGWTEGPHLASQSLLGRQPLHRSLGCAHPARPLPCSRGWGFPSLSCNGGTAGGVALWAGCCPWGVRRAARVSVGAGSRPRRPVPSRCAWWSPRSPGTGRLMERGGRGDYVSLSQHK